MSEKQTRATCNKPTTKRRAFSATYFCPKRTQKKKKFMESAYSGTHIQLYKKPSKAVSGSCFSTSHPVSAHTQYLSPYHLHTKHLTNSLKSIFRFQRLMIPVLYSYVESRKVNEGIRNGFESSMKRLRGFFTPYMGQTCTYTHPCCIFMSKRDIVY